jgi:2,4-dichlorophenol 6-monooxygenase
MEFCEHNVELGYCYASEAVVADAGPAPSSPDPIRIHEPSTRPGSPLPHAWIEDEDGNRRPIKDLVRTGRFLLIAGEDGEAWCEAARELASAGGVPVDAVRIGHVDGDLFDPRCTWLRRRGIGPHGAILVRPDRYVAWREGGARENPEAELAAALAQVLAHPVSAAASLY